MRLAVRSFQVLLLSSLVACAVAEEEEQVDDASGASSVELRGRAVSEAKRALSSARLEVLSDQSLTANAPSVVARTDRDKPFTCVLELRASQAHGQLRKGDAFFFDTNALKLKASDDGYEWSFALWTEEAGRPKATPDVGLACSSRSVPKIEEIIRAVDAWGAARIVRASS